MAFAVSSYLHAAIQTLASLILSTHSKISSPQYQHRPNCAIWHFWEGLLNTTTTGRI